MGLAEVGAAAAAAAAVALLIAEEQHLLAGQLQAAVGVEWRLS